MEYTLTDAAKLVRLNKSTVFRAIKSGRLSARRMEGGTYMVDASELARVYDLQRISRNDSDAMQSAATEHEAPAMAAMAGQHVVEIAVLRTKLQAAEDRLTREHEDRERERLLRDQEREEHGETVRDLRKRLDRAEERVLALSVQVTQPVPQTAREQTIEQLEMADPPKASKGFLARLLGL